MFAIINTFQILVFFFFLLNEFKKLIDYTYFTTLFQMLVNINIFPTKSKQSHISLLRKRQSRKNEVLFLPAYLYSLFLVKTKVCPLHELVCT